jgi:hypothetical protein
MSLKTTTRGPDSAAPLTLPSLAPKANGATRVATATPLSPSNLVALSRRAAPGKAPMQSRCARLPQMGASEVLHASGDAAVDAAEHHESSAAPAPAPQAEGGAAAVATSQSSSAKATAATTSAARRLPANLQEQIKRQHEIKEKRATYTDELAFNLPFGVAKKNGEFVDIKEFNLNCQVKVNGREVACRHFVAARLQGGDSKKFFEASKTPEGITAYFSGSPFHDDSHFHSRVFSATHQASVSGAQVGSYIQNVASQLRDRQAAEGGKTRDSVKLEVFSENHAMSVIVRSDFDKKTGKQYIDIEFYDPNRTLCPVPIKTKNPEALADLTMSTLLTAKGEIDDSLEHIYQKGEGELQLRMVTSDLPAANDKLQFATKNEHGVEDSRVCCNAIVYCDNEAINSIYQALAISDMPQSQMVEYMAAAPIGKFIEGMGSIDSRAKMIEDRMDFIENNVDRIEDKKRLICGEPGQLNIGIQLFIDCFPFDVFASAFAKSTLPKEDKVDILNAKYADGTTVLGLAILHQQTDDIDQFVDMMKACDITGEEAAEIILAKNKNGASAFSKAAIKGEADTLEKIIDRFPDLGIKSDLALDILLVETTANGSQSIPAMCTAVSCDLLIKALKNPKLEINYDDAIDRISQLCKQASPSNPNLESLYYFVLDNKPLPNQPDKPSTVNYLL